jgi:predicted phosphodiesterase
MNIQLASDLHLEFLLKGWPDERLISPEPGADILVLAGDVSNGADAMKLFANWPVPVIYVMGNHECSGDPFSRERLRDH